jgi:MOSC domain-containing protein YiiM
MPLLFEGTLLSIHIAEAASVEMETLEEAELVAGVGITGDRYATAKGTYSDRPHADRQVTLIEEETLVALKRDHGIDLAPEETRRNLVVREVPLNHLVGRQFRVGSVLLYGGRLNVPCAYLDELLGKLLFGPLTNRSGLNCRIIEGGVIRPGDRIVPA